MRERSSFTASSTSPTRWSQRGHKTPAVNLWVKGEQGGARAVRERRPRPDALSLPAYLSAGRTRAAADRAPGAAGRHRSSATTELLGFEDRGGRIAARLRGPDGAGGSLRGRLYRGMRRRPFASCARPSAPAFPAAPIGRSSMSPMSTRRVRAIDGELHVDLDEADFLAVFPLAGEGRARLIGTVRDERADHPETLKFEDVSDRAIQHLKIQVQSVNWFSTYHVHHRVTEHFRKGRAFLLGDAAHIHSPAGGQGMNTGIGDAINLAWKLASVLAGQRAATACSTAMRPSGSVSPGGWSRRPIGPSVSPPRKGRRRFHAHSRRAVADPGDRRVRGGARISLSHRCAVHPELSGRPAQHR